MTGPSPLSPKEPLAPWWRTSELPLDTPEAIEDLVGFISGSWLWLERGQVRTTFDGYRDIADDFSLVRDSYGRLIRAAVVMARDHLSPCVDHLATLKDISGWDGIDVYELSGFVNPAPFPKTLIALAKRVGDHVRRREVALVAVQNVRRALLENRPPDRHDVDAIVAEIES